MSEGRAYAVLALVACLSAVALGWLHLHYFGPVTPEATAGARGLAQIVAIDARAGQRQPTTRVRYRFETPDGATVDGTAEVAPDLAARWTVDDYIDVLYDPADPATNRPVDDGGGRAMQRVILVMFDVLVIVAGVIGWRRHRRG